MSPINASQLAEIIKDRIRAKAAFRLGGHFPGTPSNPLEVAADEIYERNGLEALKFPDSKFAEYMTENARRLGIQADRYTEFGY